MKVTDVRINLVDEPPRGERCTRLLACFSVVLEDQLVIYGLKLLRGPKGWILSMPSVKKAVACKDCRKKNPLDNAYCGGCGIALPPRVYCDATRLHYDVTHPTKQGLRDHLLDVCHGAYLKEKETPGTYPRLNKPGEDYLLRQEAV